MRNQETELISGNYEGNNFIRDERSNEIERVLLHYKSNSIFAKECIKRKQLGIYVSHGCSQGYY